MSYCAWTGDGSSSAVLYCTYNGEGTMIDSFTFQIDWIIISVVIGLLVALIGAFLYPRRDLD